MLGLCVKLGYYPLSCDIRAGDIYLSTLPDIEQSIAEVQTASTINNDWIYGPLKRSRDIFSGQSKMLPYGTRIFGLPKTHVLTHQNTNSVDHLEFIVWCISFFVGMRLTITEAGFLDATPIKPRKLTDFSLGKGALIKAIELSEIFWVKYSSDIRNIKRITGIINVLFLSQYPQLLAFEKFTHLYTALDACFAHTKSCYSSYVPSSLPHAKRLEWMCQQFKMQPPEWALNNQQGRYTSEVSMVRNDALHEALFFDQPLGFAIYGGNKPSGQRPNVLFEMQALTCRLLVALLGGSASVYVKSPVDTRQMHLLSL